MVVPPLQVLAEKLPGFTRESIRLRLKNVKRRIVNKAAPVGTHTVNPAKQEHKEIQDALVQVCVGVCSS